MQSNSWVLDEMEMEGLAKALAMRMLPGTVMFLMGELGAGKTTFVRGVLRALGYQGIVKSPTYTLVEEYDIKGFLLYHFDLYRVGEAFELELIGIQEYFDDKSLCFIEWPEKGAGCLPPADLHIALEVLDNKRHIQIQALTKNGKMILAGLVESCHE